MKNPQPALSALNAPALTPVCGYHLRDITLGMAGILEAIGSPLYSGSRPDTITGWVPTLYAMTRDPEDSRRLLAAGLDTYTATATAWADTELPLNTARRLIEAITGILNRLNAIDPSDDSPDREDRAEGNVTAAGPTAG